MLPAYAGMIRISHTRGTNIRCAPRVCGDDPANTINWATYYLVLPAYAGMIP